ncbi:MAG: helix-turn-helix domain-containing protein [Solirubrobacteraceae bacterium]
MDQSDAPDSFLTVAEVAGILKLNQQTVRNWIDQGSLPALRVGRRVRIRRSDFDRILAEGYTGGSGSSGSGGSGGSGSSAGSGPSGGSGESGGLGPSGGSGSSGGPGSSGAPGTTGQRRGPTAEDFWGGEAGGLAPAIDDPAAGNGNSA